MSLCPQCGQIGPLGQRMGSTGCQAACSSENCLASVARLRSFPSITSIYGEGVTRFVSDPKVLGASSRTSPRHLCACDQPDTMPVYGRALLLPFSPSGLPSGTVDKPTRHRDRGRHSDASRVAGRYRATAQRPRTASSVSMRIVSRTERCAARCRPSHGTNPSEDWRREAGRQLRDQLDVPARRTPNRDLLIQLPAEPPSRGHLTKRSRSTNGTSVRVVVLVRQAGSSR